MTHQMAPPDEISQTQTNTRKLNHNSLNNSALVDAPPLGELQYDMLSTRGQHQSDMRNTSRDMDDWI